MSGGADQPTPAAPRKLARSLAILIAGAVITPGSAQVPSLRQDTDDATNEARTAADLFSNAYRAAGNPRIVLFWNAPFDADTHSTEATVDVTQDAQGSLGLAEGLTTNGVAQLHATFNTTLSRAKQHPRLAAPEEAVLESSFRQTLRDSGVRLVDRSTAIRFTAAEKDRQGVDAKLIESDAVKDKADVLLEITMLTDLESPLGRGFEVVATHVATGEEVARLYTLAQPPAPHRTGRYIGTDQGFKWEAPPPWIPPVEAIGRTLARDVMGALSPTLGPANRKARTEASSTQKK